MAKKHSARRVRRTPKAVQRLPDLNHAKSGVRNAPLICGAVRNPRTPRDQEVRQSNPEFSRTPRTSGYNSAIRVRFLPRN
jgi:hypothetical protein